MNKVLIVSDSHGLEAELTELKKRHPDAQLMIHCGDSELFASNEAIENYLVVRGNCDYEKSFPTDVTAELGGLRFFVTHGHLYSVKNSLMRLFYRAEEENANIVCFGHSHMLGAEMIDDILFINPGSLRLPRGRKEKTYCILELAGDSIELQVFDFHQGELTALRKNFHFSKD